MPTGNFESIRTTELSSSSIWLVKGTKPVPVSAPASYKFSEGELISTIVTDHPRVKLRTAHFRFAILVIFCCADVCFARSLPAGACYLVLQPLPAISSGESVLIHSWIGRNSSKVNICAEASFGRHNLVPDMLLPLPPGCSRRSYQACMRA